MKCLKVAALPLAVALTFVPVAAWADPNTESTLPQDGVQSISRDGGTWTITFDGTPWESKIISNPQKILCGTNYGKPCKTVETFTWEKPCVYIQTDWQGSHNSSDIYVCRDEPSTSPTPTPSTNPTPSSSETATPSPEYEYWDKTTVDCKGGAKNIVFVDHYRRVKGTSKWTWISKDKTAATVEQCPVSSEAPTPSPTPSSSANASTPITIPSPSESEPSNEPSPTSEPSSSTPVVLLPPHTAGGTAATHPAEAAPAVTTGSTTHTSGPGTDQPGTQTSVREVHLAHTGLASSGLGISGLLIAVGLVLLIVRRKAAK